MVVAGQAFPLERGIKRRAIVKYGLGGLLLFLLIFIIWFPLMLFSLSSTIFVPDPPIDVTLNIKFWGYQVLVHRYNPPIDVTLNIKFWGYQVLVHRYSS